METFIEVEFRTIKHKSRGKEEEPVLILVKSKCSFICSDRLFTINDKNVGKLSAVKIRLVKKGLYEDFWQLRQVRQQLS